MTRDDTDEMDVESGELLPEGQYPEADPSPPSLRRGKKPKEV